MPEPEFLCVLRVLRRIVRGELVMEEDPSNVREITDRELAVGTMTLE